MVSANNKSAGELKDEKKNRSGTNAHSIIGSNGHLTAVSSSTPAAGAGEDAEKDEAPKRVGKAYQAEIPELLHSSDEQLERCPERAQLVWAPNSSLYEHQLEEYLWLAKDKYGYNAEQALGMLFWHRHDLERATSDLANFTPLPDEWTTEDKVLFEQAFMFHGKTFTRIRQMLPDKSIAQLVKYYYLWKKTRQKNSLLDKHCKKHAAQLAAQSALGNGKNEDLMAIASSGSVFSKNNVGPSAFSASHGAQHPIIKRVENEVIALKRQVQANKAELSYLRTRVAASGGITDYRPSCAALRLNAKWSNDELLLAVQGVRQYGRDFKALAEIIGNKSENHVRSFFATYRKRYNLDQALREWEAQNSGVQQDPQPMETDISTSQRGSAGASTSSSSQRA
ncbi:REST corepressor 1 [Hyalella azteca]|uniref:REST corepressor 1 n=1 Tax=Hyalella azteca TaxID=294128 RepID=A0A8B7NK45_HYAAZ|nr:REST corepressor 1 [Hyalella azteca]